MTSPNREELTFQKNIFGLIFLLYSVTYIANHATSIFSLKGLPKEILHYSGEVILILCAIGYEVFGMISKKGERSAKFGLFYRIPVLFWLGCGGVFLNTILLVASIVTGRCEK